MTQEHNYRLGFALMLASVTIDAVSVLLIKWVVDIIDPLAFFFWRALFSSLFLIPFTVIKQGVRWQTLKQPYMGLIFFSSACLIICVMAFNISLRHIPVAASYAINQSAPLMVAMLSIVLLRDRISTTHWLAITAGMLGTLCIIEPWGTTFNMWSVWIFLATILYAVYLTINSWLSTRVNTAVLVLYTTVAGLVMSVPFAFNDISMMTWQHWLMIAVLAAVGLAARYTCIYAFKHAPASYLTPLEYLSVPMTALGGWLVYSQQVGWAFYIGATVTIGAGLYIFYTPHHVTRGAKAVFDSK